MNQHPAQLEAITRDRLAELRQSAEAWAIRERGTRRRRATAAARQGTGWLLVDLGLRLAVPRGSRPA